MIHYLILRLSISPYIEHNEGILYLLDLGQISALQEFPQKDVKNKLIRDSLGMILYRASTFLGLQRAEKAI